LEMPVKSATPAAHGSPLPDIEPLMNPLLILLCGMGVVVTGVLGFRLHAVLALVLGAYVVALLTPGEALQNHATDRVKKMEWTQKTANKFVNRAAASRVAEELGRTCANLGILIAMATVLGEAMMLSGAAEAIAAAMLRIFGANRAPWAFFSSSFLLCIPVMLDTVMYLLAPLFKAVARRTGRDYLLLVMATVAGGTITHSLVPPTPGPLFVAGELGVPLGLMIGMGSVIGLGAALFGMLFARYSNRTFQIPLPEPAVGPETASRKLPPLWIALLPVVLPLALIGMDASFTASLEQSGSSWAVWIKNIGDKDMALTLGAVCALAPLAFGNDRSEASKAIRLALESGAAILLIIAAGGAFGGVLQQTGIASELASHFSGAQSFALPLVFVVTTLVRTAQGSATVAMITAAPIAKAFLSAGGTVHPVYFAIAIGCGSKPFAWMNDAGFWIISRLSGMRESEMLRTVSPMMAFQGVMGLILTMCCARWFPLN
jgi:GntP family gluconate:H+ symporter